MRPELMDGDGLTPAESARALADLARANRWLLGYRPVLRALLPRLGEGPRRQLLLDVGTGAGDVPAVLARAARRRGVRLAVVGLDARLRHLLFGRAQGIGQRRLAGSATALPFADGAFDWVLSTLFFHHFDAATNLRVLAEMRRVARRGAVVVDLRRCRPLLWSIRPALRLLGMGAVARHDGHLSAAQSWTPEEVAALLAGEPILELRRRFPFRFSLVLPPLPAAKRW